MSEFGENHGVSIAPYFWF